MGIGVAALKRISSISAYQDLVVQYFQTNRDEINELLRARLIVVGRRYEDDLDFHSVQAELLVRLRDTPRQFLNGELIRKHLDEVISEKGLDDSNRRFANKILTVGNMGRENSHGEESPGAEFLLHQERDHLTSGSPATHEKLRRHKSAEIVILEPDGKEVSIPNFQGITKDRARWAKLSWKQYLVIISFLSGLGRKEIAELLNINNEDVTQHAYKARKKLEISLEQLRKTARGNKQKALRKDTKYAKAQVYKWLYASESKDEQSADAASKLVMKLLPKLTIKQKETLELLCRGYTFAEILDITGRTRDSINESLHGAKQKILNLIDALNNPLTPPGVDYEKWNHLSKRAQEIYHTYVLEGKSLEEVLDQFAFSSEKNFYTRMKDTRKVLGISVQEMDRLRDVAILQNASKNKHKIVERTLATVFPEGAAINASNDDDIAIQKSEIFRQVCRSFKNLRTNTNKRPFKLHIRGLDHIRIAHYLNQAPSQCKRAIQSVAQQIHHDLAA